MSVEEACFFCIGVGKRFGLRVASGYRNCMVDHECPVRLGDSMGCSMGGSIRDVTKVGGRGDSEGVAREWELYRGSTGDS